MKKVLFFVCLLFSLNVIVSCQNNNTSVKTTTQQNKDVQNKENNNSKAPASKIDSQKNEPLVINNMKAINNRPTNDENYSDFKKSKNGLLYKFHRLNEGPTVTNMDVIEIEMDYFLNDSLLFTSSTYPKQFKVPVEKPVFKGDFYEGILMMHPGDSASFVVRADSTYIKLWNLPANNIKPSDVVRFDISIVSKEDRVAFGQKLYEKKKTEADKSRTDLQVYLHDNDIVERPRPSGLIVVPIIKGYGPKATSDDKVRVHYTATLIDGRPYKSTRTQNVPEILTLSNLGKEYPRGLDEALHQMRVGDVTKFIIPSHLAFGQEERAGVPPFANFVYEVELLEIIK